MPLTRASRRAWAYVGVWAAIVFTLTSLPGSQIPVSIPHPLDWVGHFGMYAVLGWLIARAEYLNRSSLRRLVAIAFAVVVVGALDEVHQLWIPGREAAVSDWLADSLGGATGLTVGAYLMKSRMTRWLR